ncbi:restriction endonuclease subunit S [Cellulophaga sp. Hel_I_12]|uniref:restriction endonuclease subunit S n=1 Tax=Cellulophaga sp. Hel_I_12 TaxID=1249972 RepID=UPI000A68736E|nr:restriction endonuclease subunit S [Cellulophaga sp. Hel_I_12]
MTQKIDLNNLDKSTWEIFNFEDIAQKISETVNPNKTDLETYVGLEHLDADDIHIRRFGTPNDVKGGKLRCYPGDVIFGKRRAYQRKAAIVDFDGICSAHAFVFRANPEIIDPKLFPFFLHSDQFMHRMVDISVGGLSPTINWGDLKQQEFLLPPKDQQAKFAELLWAMDDVIESEKEFVDKLRITLSSEIKSLFEKSKNKIQIKHLILKNRPKKSEVGIIPYIEIGDINLANKTIEFKDKESVKGSVIASKNSVLVSKVRPNRGAITILNEEQVVSNGFSILLPDCTKVAPNYLFHCLAWNQYFLSLMSRLATGSTYPTISDDDVLNYFIPSFILDAQEELAFKYDKIYNSIIELESKISSSKALQKSLINQVF